MNIESNSKNSYYKLYRAGKSGVTVQFFNGLDSSNASIILKELTPLLKSSAPVKLTADLSKVTYMDDMGALVMIELRRMAARGGGNFNLKHVSEKIHDTLSSLNFDSLGLPQPTKKEVPPGLLIRLGDSILRPLPEIKYLISFIGSICLALIYVLRHPRTLRVDDTLKCMKETGVEALPIVGVISFLLGLIMAFMSSVQLQQFGANIYVASLVSLSMTRELGPIMTAIIVAGRSGSAFAAEIGSMQISEEVDALFTMGFDPTRFLVVPKIIASIIVVPFLTLFSDVFAILGGLLVGITMLDLTTNAYMVQTVKTLSLFDVFLGFFKSGVFAFLIAWVGCLKGFRVRGGSVAVGQATTSAVVSSIFLIILFDSIFSVILRYWE
ncbi:MlaE family lipid ABC transporter permease subunit [Thermodesulfobacteriota bacterium]